MRLFAIALLLVACDGCSGLFNPQPPPLPTATGTPPPPVMADAGPTCQSACAAAVAECARPSRSVEQCVARCTEGMRQLTGARPGCLAPVLVCNDGHTCGISQ